MKEYERLRAHRLTGSTHVRPAGLLELLRHGMASWRARRTTAWAAPLPTPPTAPPSVHADRHAALVPILLNMVLGTDRQGHL